MKQFDERDTMFSRRGLINGTKKYNDYYKMHPELQVEDDRVRESTKNMMAKIFGVEMDHLMITQKIMAIRQKIMNILSSLRIKKIQKDASDMPIMYSSGKDDEIVRSHITISKPALIAAKAINNAAYKQKISKYKVKTDPEKLTTFIKELALSYGGDAARYRQIGKAPSLFTSGRYVWNGCWLWGSDFYIISICNCCSSGT